MAAFGKLWHLRRETTKINRLIEEEFEQIEVEDRLDFGRERTLSGGRGGIGARTDPS